jgi:hypothetical protein
MKNLYSGGVWSVLELPDEPVHSGRGPAFAWRLHVDMASDLRRAQVGGDHKVPDSVRDPDGAGQLAGLAQRGSERLHAGGRVGGLLTSKDWNYLGPELTAELETGEPQKSIEAGNHLGDALVGDAQGARSHLVADTDPRLSHVLELQRPGLAVLQVADELTENPGLVRIGDAAELLLHDRLGEHLRPGDVVQRHLP